MSSQALAIRFSAEPLRTLAAGSIVAGYTGIGTIVDHAIRILYVQNLTDARLLFSFDGVTDHFVLPENGFLLLDVTSNQTYRSGFFMPERGRVYVKQDQVPTTGNCHVSVFYGAEV